MKTLKKILLSALSILGISFLVWTVLLLNPSLSYAHRTDVGQVSIYHNQLLQEGTTSIIQDALDIIEGAEIFDKDLKIQYCLNDDKIYPDLYPLGKATAYAFLNKTVMYASQPNFTQNYTEFKWEINNYELRKFNLTSLLAHEFMHNVQHHHNPKYQITSTLGKLNWILEGHAEYISRKFKNDGRLADKISKYLDEEKKTHVGIPVFLLEDGTIQSLGYYKNALVIQYLMEVKKLNYDQICASEPSIDESYSEMIEWYKR